LATNHLDLPGNHINWDITEFALSPDGKTIAYVSNEDGISLLHMQDVANRTEISVPEIPKSALFGLMWHPRLPYVGSTLSTQRFASRVFPINSTMMILEQWTTADCGINTGSVKEPELVRWWGFDG